MVADYSQIELRIAAKISADKRMLAAFANGEDIHTITARSLTGREEVTKQERKLAKAVNFGLFYGMEPGRLEKLCQSELRGRDDPEGGRALLAAASSRPILASEPGMIESTGSSRSTVVPRPGRLPAGAARASRSLPRGSTLPYRARAQTA